MFSSPLGVEGELPTTVKVYVRSHGKWFSSPLGVEGELPTYFPEFYLRDELQQFSSPLGVEGELPFRNRNNEQRR